MSQRQMLFILQLLGKLVADYRCSHATDVIECALTMLRTSPALLADQQSEFYQAWQRIQEAAK